MNKLKNFPPVNFISIEESVDRQKILYENFEKYEIKNITPHIYKKYNNDDHKIVGKNIDSLVLKEHRGPVTSHLKAIKEWYENTDEEYAFFCEDDLSFETVEYWNFTWEEFFNRLPHNWECVQLCFISTHNDYTDERIVENKTPFRYRDWCDWSGCAYLIKRSHAKNIVENYFDNDTIILEYRGFDYNARVNSGDYTWLIPSTETMAFTYFIPDTIYFIPLFVEDLRFNSTWSDSTNNDSYHKYSHEKVLNWWKNTGVSLSIDKLLERNLPFDFKSLDVKYKMNISGVIHVGAHYGEEVSDYIESGIENIILFEPLKDNFNILSERLMQYDKNIIAYNTALGSDQKRTVMYVSDNEKQSSSILIPNIHLTHHPDVSFPDLEEVNVEVLDNFDCSEYNYLHIDVQGYELEVLKGASDTLKHIDYVCCEVNREELYEGNAYVEEIDEFLKQYGMERVETYWMGDIWGDALYIKNKVTDYHRCLSHAKINSSSVVVDVGCNIDADYLDDFTEILFSMYPNAKCIGIEPVFWEKYEQKWSNDARVTLIKKALSDTVTKKMLYVPSIYTELDHGLTSFYKRKIFNSGSKIQQIEVECTTLDSLFSELNLEFIDYLKIDTEGAELLILQGCKELLNNNKIKYIQLEYGETYDDASYTVSDVIDFLKKYNYSLVFKTDYNNCGEMLFSKE